jgi:glycogen debranching enzyme
LVTGDRDFLVTAHLATENSLRYLEKEEFDAQKGLFRGGACFQDGVSGYPDRYARHGTSDIRHWVEAHPQERAPVGAGLPMMATSTNCLYYSAYHCAALMKEILGEPGAELCRTKGARLRAAIQQHLWNEATGNFHYLIDPWGTCSHQEGLGSAFAILLGLTEPAQTSRVLASQHITPHGIPCVWPSFDRYRSDDGTSYGRHSGTIWPQVQGFWAEAAAQSGRPDLLLHELVNLSTQAVRDAQFTEIYHPDTGEIYGGCQEPFEGGPVKEWESCRRQTWSATAYLRMILHGVLGLKFTPEGLSFRPQTAEPLTSLKLTRLPYRDSILQIELEGTGSRLSEFRVNGQKRESAFISATEKGPLDLFLRVTA